MSERLHKLLAQRGLGSRREIEKWILAGRVLLNGKPAQPGDQYSDGDRVVVDGQEVTGRLRVSAAAKVIAYHKPQGQPVDSGAADAAQSASGDESVMERLPSVRGSRWLVINTMQAGDSGLLLLTTDGQLANALRRHSESIPAAYVARVLVPHPEFDIESIPRVVQYDDATVEFESIEPAGGEGTNRWFRVNAPRAHRRTAVRALFESSGLKVSRVIQVQFADLELPRDLPRGKHRELTDQQIARLYKLAEVEQPTVVTARPPRGLAKVRANAASGKKPRGSNRPSRPQGRSEERLDERPEGRGRGRIQNKSGNRATSGVPGKPADGRSGERSFAGKGPAGKRPAPRATGSRRSGR
ncbi:MAG TPA: S4 domain-containing protein [Steroidobacteraceae bacterium]